MARPTKYKAEFAEQSKRLCLLGLTDNGLAFFFGVDISDIALWAWDHKEFFDAITPSEECLREFREARSKDKENRNARSRKRRKSNPSERIRNAVSARMWAALKGRSDGKLFSRLGYSSAELARHLELMFKDGMSWGNYGDWHVDHIKPCASFDLTVSSEFDECWSLNNLQPLWAEENLRKGSRYASAERE